MKRILLLLFVACVARAEWRPVAKGIDYQRITRGTIDAHVARIDVREPSLRIIATDKRDSGLTVSQFAKRKNAIIAINGDYFDPQMNPFGLSIGACGVWAQPKPARREPVVAIGKGRVSIDFWTRKRTWMSGGVAGWPMLVQDCAVIQKLPGSDFFTNAPHPRTAVGLSRDRRTMYLVVSDGRRPGVPGPTLPELALFMKELGACVALNLDGGGSTAMWVGDAIVNQFTDPAERKVTNHIAVVAADDYTGCDRKAKE